VAVIAAFLPLGELDAHLIASAFRSDDASGWSMLIADAGDPTIDRRVTTRRSHSASKRRIIFRLMVANPVTAVDQVIPDVCVCVASRGSRPIFLQLLFRSGRYFYNNKYGNSNFLKLKAPELL
jgi:hypothetical protein